MNNRISIYGHSGSYNHGNEAVVRGLCKILDLQYLPNLYCTSPYIDTIFELDEICNLIDEGGSYPNNLERYTAKVLCKLFHTDRFCFKTKYEHLLENVQGIYLFTAEDQYCEPPRVVEWFEYQNRELNRRGAKTVAVGCTIKESIIGKEVKLQDLERYALIIARESLTYQALLKHGLNAKLAPCTAFAMDSCKCPLPEAFQRSDVIGINAGPLAQGNEKYMPLYYKNTIKLIKYILKETDYTVALIPHMNWRGEFSDINLHNQIWQDLGKNERILLIRENTAPKQKYIISNCRMVVTVRTHVSIPAYASCVPTLVTGYKTKSIGIAKDIFGTSENYVVSIQDLKSESDFVNGFVWLADREEKIRSYLHDTMPEYINRTKNIRRWIESLS